MEGPSPFRRPGTERWERTESLGEIRLDRNPLPVVPIAKNTIHRRERERRKREMDLKQ